MRLALGLLLSLACSAWASALRADDVRVDSETTLQAYDVQSPASSVIWARRRLTQTLGLHYVKPLAPDARGPAPSLQLVVRLRLDRDFGDTCLAGRDICFAVVNPERRGSYSPTVERGGIDLPAAYVEARDLPLGAELRAGRQLQVDQVGMLRLDGLAARLEPYTWLGFELAAGALVRRTSFAGSDAFDAGDRPALELDADERARLAAFYPPGSLATPPAWVASLGAALGSERLLRARVTARTLHEAGGYLEQRLGLSLATQPSERLRFDARSVLDLLDPEVLDAELGAELRARPWSGQLRLERHVPRFEPSTIWAYFDVAPTGLLSLAGRVELGPSALASASLRGRRTEFASGSEYDLGFDGSIALFDARDTLALAGFGWIAEQGPLWGLSVSGSHRFSHVVALEADLSLYRIDDPLREALEGVSLQELLGLHVTISDESSLLVTASHSYSSMARNRLAFMLFLRLGAWR